MQKYQDVVLNQNGNPVSGVQVTVTDLAGSPVAVYSSNAIGLNVNPLTSDNNGRFSFYAPDGRYSLTFTFGGNVVASISDILLEDPMDGSDAVFNDVTMLGSLSDASKITSAAVGGISATNVQDALSELDSDKASNADLSLKINSADLAAPGGAAIIGFQQSGTGSTPLTVQKKIEQVVNVKDYGAAPANTNAQNKAALQAAISAVNAAGGGQIVIDYGINYGLKTRTPLTWPDFTGVTSPILVIDYSTGDTQAPNVYPDSYDGAMCRLWACTPQTTSPGQHDGNTQWLRAAWAPAFCVSNDMSLAAVGHPSRTASDNRRAYYATMVDGQANWQWGNGNLAGSAYTDEELSNFIIQKYAMDGDTLGSYTPYQVERKTGNISYGGGRSIPVAHHHFEAVTGSPTLNIAMFESKGLTSAVTLRNSNGAGDDVEIKNVSGSFRLNIPALGDALVVAKATRYIGIGDSDPAYLFDLVESRADNFVQRTRNTSATNGNITRWESSSASSGTWSFLDAYASGTANREFQLSGNGSGYCDGAWNGGGADYAEYFEWADGNHDNEDRRGFSVSLVGNMIKKAESGDAVIGVISGNPSVVGDAAWNKWAGQFLRDDFGSYVLDADGHRVLNPSYDPEADYMPRSQRPEWGCVGLVGKLRVRNGQPVDPRWIKMREVSEFVGEWLVR